MGQDELIGGDWYPDAARAARWAPGCPTPTTTSTSPAGILWGSGDLVGLVFFAVLFVQWVRSSMQEAEREDRRLDLLEARARAPPRQAARQDDR